MTVSLRFVMKTLAAAGILAATATPSFAQDLPKAELGVGYQLVRLSEGPDSVVAPVGWFVDVAKNMNSKLAIVAAAGGNYKSVNGESFKVHGFLVGPRFSHRASSSTVVPFGQVLFGLAPASGFGTTATHPALDFGGGVNIWNRPTLGFRIGADFMHIFSGGDGENDTISDVSVFRFTVGVVIPLPRK